MESLGYIPAGVHVASSCDSARSLSLRQIRSQPPFGSRITMLPQLREPLLETYPSLSFEAREASAGAFIEKALRSATARAGRNFPAGKYSVLFEGCAKRAT